MEATDVTTLIREQGLHWTAADTALSQLAILQKQSRLGAVPHAGALSLAEREAVSRDRGLSASQVAGATLPTSVDWRNMNRTNYVTPVEDQGDCGSCVAFGTVAAFEANVQIARGNPQPPADLSEADLWFCWGPAHGAGACPGGGWWPDSSFPGCVPGIVDAACFPYTAANQSCNRCSSAASRLTKITNWHSVSAVTDMKTWLATHGPVTTCFTVYDDFYNYTSGVYSPVNSPTNQVVGGHCICVVGYNDADSCWICKNSWGTGWGENGFFQIAYGACGIDAEMWCIDGIIPLWNFGNISADPKWIGNFTGSGTSEVLFYSPGDQNWWLGTFTGTQMGWALASNTSGFGNTQNDPTWIGDFAGSGKSEVLFYSPGDQNWWLGTFTGTSLGWTLAGNTKGFGNTQNDPTRIGSFTGSGKAEVLFYSPGDQNWWLGTFTGTSLGWTLAGNTKGFGNTQNDPTWIGSFTGGSKADVLFYSPGDQNWWLGTFTGTSLGWTLAGNTKGFGNTQSDPTWIGDFTGSGDLLFYSPGDQNWWLGTFNGTSLSWTLAGNTKGFGNTQSDPTWIGNFTGGSDSEVLFYSPGDSNWWLGRFAGTQLSWILAVTT